MLDWLVPVVLQLNQFFERFSGQPHQLAAIQQLQEDMPEELLREDAQWFELWRASGKDRTKWNYAPYYRQLDLPDGENQCVTSTMAMLAATYALVADQWEYFQVRQKHGPTEMIASHVWAMEELGAKVEFIRDGSADLLLEEVRAGRPVAVGFLHKGDITTGRPPEGFGHWALVIGAKEGDYLVLHDPRGEYDMGTGQLISSNGFAVRYDWEDFMHRWEVEGPGNGWAILIDDLSL